MPSPDFRRLLLDVAFWLGLLLFLAVSFGIPLWVMMPESPFPWPLGERPSEPVRPAEATRAERTLFPGSAPLETTSQPALNSSQNGASFRRRGAFRAGEPFTAATAAT